jgi:hypothetical protein
MTSNGPSSPSLTREPAPTSTTRRDSPASLDALNKKVLNSVQASGIAMPSQTKLDGRFVIRVAITNHRSRREDFDMLIDAVRRAVGEALARSTDIADES